MFGFPTDLLGWPGPVANKSVGTPDASEPAMKIDDLLAAVFKDAPGEGPDCHLPQEMDDFATISARIRGVNPTAIFILTLSTA